MLKKQAVIFGPNRSTAPSLYSALSDSLEFNGFSVTLYALASKSVKINTILNLKDSDLAIFANDNFYDISENNFIKIINSVRCKTIYIGFDDEYKLKQSLYFAQFMDLMLTFDPVAFYYMKQLGINVRTVPHPVQMNAFPSQRYKKYKYDISFVGDVFKCPSRLSFIKEIKRRYPDAYIPGLSGKHLSDEEMLDVFYNSKINLNFSMITSGPSELSLFKIERRGFKGRPFEIGSAANFCLSEYSPALEIWLKDGHHISYFNDVEECINLIDFYLNDSISRELIANNLHKWVARYCSPYSTENLFITEIVSSLANGAVRKTTKLSVGAKFPTVARARFKYRFKQLAKYFLLIIRLFVLKFRF
ncbi:glycosyltransferase [Alphaproteobacteria bacterium]|nr:glycosyltransferase [Alphaproteobacteria bacterium]